MPVYEFVCLACEGHFDKLLPMSAVDPACPTCGETRVRRRLSLIAGLTGAASGRASAGSSGCGCGGNCACGR